MSRTVDAAFAVFDSNLNLDPSNREHAQAIHNDVRDALQATNLVADSFLQGSFARKTMLKPLKDVDIVLLLNPAHRAELLVPDGPATIMRMFQPPILKRWPDARFDEGEEPAGKALRITLPDCEFTVDLVPAFEEDPPTDYILIGDRDERGWERSNSRIQRRKVRERNIATGGRFVHQVRMLKAYRKQNEDALEFVKGIAIEALAYGAIKGRVPHKYALQQAFHHAAVAVTSPVVEPAGDDDVTIKWTPDQRQVAAGMFADAAMRADEALRLEEAGDVETAIDAWFAVLGDAFPEAATRPLAEAAAALAAGSISRAGRPSISRAADQQAAPGRSWASR